jgi:hypothetical protein
VRGHLVQAYLIQYMPYIFPLVISQPQSAAAYLSVRIHGSSLSAPKQTRRAKPRVPLPLKGKKRQPILARSPALRHSNQGNISGGGRTRTGGRSSRTDAGRGSPAEWESDSPFRG